MKQCEVRVVADSVSPHGVRLTTMELTYPRFIHGEVMTHRVFSRNAASSRAIPVSKMLRQVRENPVIPIHWGANQPGMQARQEVSESVAEEAKKTWGLAAQESAAVAEYLSGLGIHKQICNRLLEPFQIMKTLVTATEWDNFFALRCHADAEPHMELLAEKMYHKYRYSTPNEVGDSGLHLPYVSMDEVNIHNNETLFKISTARCARVSYTGHDGKPTTIDSDIKLADKLMASIIKHGSPAEHPAEADDVHDPKAMVKSWNNPDLHGNFTGWIQYRKTIDGENIKNYSR